MKIVFTTLPGDITANGFERGVLPSMAVYMLSSTIQKKGYEVKILDPVHYVFGLDDDVYMKIRKELLDVVNDDDIVCLSSNTFNWALTKVACSIIKKETKATVIVGGLHPSVFYEYIMENTNVDYVIRGEGDSALSELVDRIAKNLGMEGMIGISYRKEGKIIHNEGYNIADIENMEDYALPLFDQLPDAGYNIFPLETSRGCLFSCAFCSIPFRHKRRVFNEDIVRMQMEYCKKYVKNMHYSRKVNLLDDCFTYDPERVQRLIDVFADDSYGFQLSIEARINDLLKDNLIDMLKADSIYNIQIGVECGYDEGLRFVGKGTDVRRLRLCAQKIYENNLYDTAFFSFIIGFPWETEEDINKTLDMIEELCQNYKITVSLNWLIMLPSRLWDKQHEYNMDLNPSLFDRVNWYSEKDTFYLTHPKLDEKIFRRTERRILALQAEGYKIVHGTWAFNFCDALNDRIEQYL